MSWFPNIYNWLWNGPPEKGRHAPTSSAPIHGLRGLLYSLDPTTVDGSMNQVEYERNIAHHLQVQYVVEHKWPHHLATPFIIKGLDYGLNLYQHIGFRRSNDVDILVNETQFVVVTDYLAQSMERRTDPKENRFSHESPSAVTFESEGITIDVHQALVMRHQTKLAVESLQSRSCRGTLGGRTVYYPNNFDRLWIWLHNFSKNFQPITAHTMVDFVLILKSLKLHSSPELWPLIYSKAKKLGLLDCLCLALQHLSEMGLWITCLPMNTGSVFWYEMDKYLRHKNSRDPIIDALKALTMLRRTPPSQRLDVARRFLARLSEK